MNAFFKGILDGINLLFGNYGWSIMAFTLLVRLICFPLDYKSRVSMRRTTLIQPEIEKLQKKYGNDKEKLNQKMAALYKQEHISPMSGCLPMLIQWPILLAMFGAMRLVSNTALVTQVFDILSGNEPVMESFFWIKNLWIPDSPFVGTIPNLKELQQVPADVWQSVFASLSPEKLAAIPQTLALTAESFDSKALTVTITSILNSEPYLASAAIHNAPKVGWTINLIFKEFTVCKEWNGLFILPILAAVSQFMMTALQNGKQTPEQKAQQSGGMNTFMKWFFPLFSLYICTSYNAAFSVYWVFSNLVAMVQTWGINLYLDKKDAKIAAIKAAEQAEAANPINNNLRRNTSPKKKQ